MSAPNRIGIVSIALTAIAAPSLRADTYEPPKASVVNNYFICDDKPKLTLKVDDNLNYVGHVHKKDEGKSGSSNDWCNIHRDHYIFTDDTPSRNVTKVLEITITNFDRPNWTFRNDLHDRISKDRLITIGRMPIAQENFYWAAITGHYLFDASVNFIHENKLGIKGKFIAKTLEHTIGFKDSTKLTITYCKSLDDSGFSGNETWTNRALYTEDQKHFVQRFLDEANSVFLMTSREAALSAPKK